MLILSRKKGQQILLEKNICITILEVRGEKVRVGIAASSDVSVTRAEVRQKRLCDRR